MSFLTNTQPNRFALWWHSTYASVERVLPLLKQNPTQLRKPELKTYQDLVHEASMRVQRESCPGFAAEIHAQIIAALCTLQTGLDARDADNLAEAESYFHLARVKWIVLQAVLEKHGVRVS